MYNKKCRRALILAIVVILLFLGTGRVFSEEASDPRFILRPAPTLWGAYAGIGLGFNGFLFDSETKLLLELGASYSERGYFRLPDRSVFAGTTGSFAGEDAPYYDRLNIAWGLGVEQGLLFDPARRANMLEVFLYYRGEYDDNFRSDGIDQLVFQANPPGAAAGGEEILTNRLILGVSFDSVESAQITKVLSGSRLEASFTWAPQFLLNNLIGSSDYGRLNVTLRNFFPMVGITSDDGMNLFSLYLALFATADLLLGDPEDVPYLARRRIGGLSPRRGLGGAVRGYDTGRYDSRLKVVSSVELRAQLPALFIPDIVPGLLTFIDGGYYSDLFDAPTGTSGDPGQEGWLVGTGLGLSLNVLDLTTVVMYLQFNLTENNVDGTAVDFPVFGFSFHF